MTKRLTIGYSPCPNDTFIMAALAQGRVETPLAFEPILADVQTLNEWAVAGRLDVTKLSFTALGRVRSEYGLLRSGSALGWGCGPLLVARPGKSLADLGGGLVAGPGDLTTACLLLGLYLEGPPRYRQMVFSEIMPAVASGAVDFGLIIHESRFTYDRYGLTALLDLGQWWEEVTGRPIPLGCLAVKRGLGPDLARQVDRAIHASLSAARRDPAAAQPYILDLAQEMDPLVAQKHIDLYVNDFSLDLGEDGLAAVQTLFSRAATAGVLPPSEVPLLAY